jgi:hypothetical protein
MPRLEYAVWWSTRCKLASYFNPLQQRHSPKDVCYKWGILECERHVGKSIKQKAGVTAEKNFGGLLACLVRVTYEYPGKAGST